MILHGNAYGPGSACRSGRPADCRQPAESLRPAVETGIRPEVHLPYALLAREAQHRDEAWFDFASPPLSDVNAAESLPPPSRPVRANPAARRRASESGIEVPGITRTARGGTITVRDVKRTATKECTTRETEGVSSRCGHRDERRPLSGLARA